MRMYKMYTFQRDKDVPLCWNLMFTHMSDAYTEPAYYYRSHSAELFIKGAKTKFYFNFQVFEIDHAQVVSPPDDARLYGVKILFENDYDEWKFIMMGSEDIIECGFNGLE